MRPHASQASSSDPDPPPRDEPGAPREQPRELGGGRVAGRHVRRDRRRRTARGRRRHGPVCRRRRAALQAAGEQLAGQRVAHGRRQASAPRSCRAMAEPQPGRPRTNASVPSMPSMIQWRGPEMSVPSSPRTPSRRTLGAHAARPRRPPRRDRRPSRGPSPEPLTSASSGPSRRRNAASEAARTAARATSRSSITRWVVSHVEDRAYPR